MNRIVLRSPAKVNLFLKVLNKRKDGYHNLVTVFERINLSDKISLELNRDGKIRIFCSNPDVPKGPKNLVYKVARLLRQEYGVKLGVDIGINKNIPVAAGLGGGSSNAASALLGLNKLWGLKLNRFQLLSIAERIGSDVSFFIYDTPWALGKERGNHIQKLNIRTKLWHVLVVPKVKIYSRDVYNGCLTNILTKRKDNVNIFIRYLKKGDLSAIGEALKNDLENSIVRLYPPLLKLKERLNLFKTKGVMISGSGPCVFGLMKNRREAKALKTILSRQFRRVFVVKTLI